MKALAVVVSLALGTSVFGQVHRSFGSVVFPGGSTNPSAGIVRNFGSAVFPGAAQVPPVFGGAPNVGARPGFGGIGPGFGGITGGGGNFLPIVNGNRSNFGRFPNNGRGFRNSTPYVFAYPVYIGGGYDNSYGPNPYGPQDMPPPQQQPNVTVVFPPQQANPVMIQAGPDGQYTTTGQRPGATIYDVPQGGAAQGPEPATDTPRYLLAFKDRTIYSVIAYWTDGDTLHYFTSGNVHNQASMSLIDRELTERLNRELGIEFKLPPAK
jgi:hypothetical protein